MLIDSKRQNNIEREKIWRASELISLAIIDVVFSFNFHYPADKRMVRNNSVFSKSELMCLLFRFYLSTTRQT